MKTYCLFISKFIFTWTNLFGEVKDEFKRDAVVTLREIISVRKNFLFVLLLFSDLACTQKYLAISLRAEERIKHSDEFLSLSYNHFEGGVFFSDVEFGLNVLWKASFKKNNAYKENVGLFVPGGFLILPNMENSDNSGNLSALPMQLKEGNPFVWYKNTLLKVLGIIHTHPGVYGGRRPTPKNDFQLCYLGMHNYVMDHNNLFDAYKDSRGRECYKKFSSPKRLLQNSICTSRYDTARRANQPINCITNHPAFP